MRTVSSYLDELIDRRIARNDADIARLLNISRATVSIWRSGGSAPGEDQAAALAVLLERPEFVAVCMAQRTKREDTKRVWEVVAQMLHEAEDQTKTARHEGGPSGNLVAWGGIEPPTRGFSIRCSTN